MPPFIHETPEQRRDSRLFVGLAIGGIVLMLCLLTACATGQL